MGMPVNILFFPIESLCMGNINLKKHPAEIDKPFNKQYIIYMDGFT